MATFSATGIIMATKGVSLTTLDTAATGRQSWKTAHAGRGAEAAGRGQRGEKWRTGVDGWRKVEFVAVYVLEGGK